MVGGPRFYERQEIRDAVAYLRLVHQPDDDLAFERIVNLPRRGIGGSTVQTLHSFARTADVSLTEAARRMIATDELNARSRNALARFLSDMDRWRSGPSEDHVRLAETVSTASTLRMWRNVRTPDGPGRLENLKELVGALSDFENLGGFLEHISLVMDRDDFAPGEMASLMTLHAAKGLEFDHVFLPAWEEDVFPNRRAVDEGGTASLEEERRLAYVGLTRARKAVTISFAASRRIFNQWVAPVPSRFVDELPREHLDIVTEMGLSREPNASAGLDFGGDEVTETVGRGPGYARLGRARRSGGDDRGQGKALDGLHRHSGSASWISTEFGYGKVLPRRRQARLRFEKAGRKTVLELCERLEPGRKGWRVSRSSWRLETRRRIRPLRGRAGTIPRRARRFPGRNHGRAEADFSVGKASPPDAAGVTFPRSPSVAVVSGMQASSGVVVPLPRWIGSPR